MFERGALVADSVRILLIDDHILVREGIARLLSAEKGLQLVGQADGARDGIQLLKKTASDIVLFAVNVGAPKIRSFLRLARAAGFAGKILVVTGGLSRRDAILLIERGCSGIALKHEPLYKLVKTIHSLMRGEAVSLPAEKAFEKFAGNAVLHPVLTAREREVLRRVFAGRTNKEIAFELKVSEPLVKAVVHQLFEKTGARSRTQLVRAAAEKYWKELE